MSDASEVLDVARRLIAAPSENPPGDERAVAAVVREALAERDIAVETVPSAPTRPNLLARVDGGEPGPRLVLCGHIDTKPAGDRAEWTYDPFGGEVADRRLYGLGAADMKGGVASIIVALGRLRTTLTRGSVVGVFTADEEAGSGFGAQFLARRGMLDADAAIIAEPAGVDEEWQRLYLGTRGSLLFRIDLEGAGGHSSLEDHHGGTSATMAMARVMVLLDEELRRLPGIAVNVGATVDGGIHYAVRPTAASVRGDVRFPPELEEAQVRDVLEDTLQRYLSASDARATVLYDELPGGPFQPLEVPSGSAIASACRVAAEQVLGHAPPDGIFPGGTDSFFTQGMAGIPTVPAFGPGCLREAHQPNEYVSLESLAVGPELLVAAARSFLTSAGA
jgi:succinyl-diaminopimelate desuccinylase